MRVVEPLVGRLHASGFYARVELDDGTEVGLVPLFDGRVRLTVGPTSGWTSYAEGW